MNRPSMPFLRVAGLAAAALVVSACSAPAARPPATVAAPAAAPAEATAAPATEAAQPAATEAPAQPAQPAAGSASLRIGILRDESTLQPYTYVTGYPGWNLLSLLYDALYVMDPDNTPKPWLATEDQVSADGKTHTIKLREGVKWQDGQPLTSADVKFSYEFYQKNTHSRWTPAVRGITSMETPDDTTIVITLENPSSGFAPTLLADVPIIPQHIWKDVTDPKTFAGSLGSGLYQIADYKPDQSYTLKANPDHFSGKPAVDELIIPIIKDPSTLFSALRAGEIDATTRGLAPELVKDFESDPAFKVQRGPGYASTMFQFNTERAPWDKKEVRQAVSLGINRQQLVDTVLLGFGTAANAGWYHPASTLAEGAPQAEYDMAKAKSILDGLGYKDSDGDGVREADGKPMEGVLIVPSNNPIRVRTAELIAAGLKDLGINLKVTAMEQETYTNKIWPDFDVSKGRDFDVAVWGWSAPVQINAVRIGDLLSSDPKNGSINVGGYKNPQVDELVSQLLVTSEPAKQTELMTQLNGIIADELPFAMLFFEDGVYAFRPNAYDGWVYQKGQGIFQKLSFQPNAKP